MSDGSLDKGYIVRMAKGAFLRERVLLAYFGGSIAYGTAGPGSDVDVNLVLEGQKGRFHIGHGELDFFLFTAEDPFGDDPGTDDSLYYKVFTDVRLGLPETLIYVDESYRGKYEELLRKPFTEGDARRMVGRAYDLLSFRFEQERANPSKTFYHAIRLSGQIDAFRARGEWTLSVSPECLAKEIAFKADAKAGNASGWEGEILVSLEKMSRFAKGG